MTVESGKDEAFDESNKDEEFNQDFDRLYRKNSSWLFLVAKALTGNDADAEDVLSNVIVNVIEARPSRDFIKNPEGYLHRAVFNEAINFFRSGKRSKLIHGDLHDLGIDSPAPASDAEEERRQRVIVALSQLDPDLAVILTLDRARAELPANRADSRPNPYGNLDGCEAGL